MPIIVACSIETMRRTKRPTQTTSELAAQTWQTPYSWRLNLQNGLFSPPLSCFTPPFGENPSEFFDETYPAKTRGIRLPHGKNSWSYRQPFLYDPPVWRTDRQTDRRTGDSALSIYATCCRALNTEKSTIILTVWGKIPTPPYTNKMILCTTASQI